MLKGMLMNHLLGTCRVRKLDGAESVNYQYEITAGFMCVHNPI